MAELDTMVDLPAAAAHSPVSEGPPPRHSECRALAVRRPPRPTPRKRPETKHVTTSSLPPPLPSPVAPKSAPAQRDETDTIELDASWIEEACLNASTAPAPTASPTLAAASPLGPAAARALDRAAKTSRRFLTFMRAVAFFVVYAAKAAIRWLRETFLPATRVVAADARDRLLVEWARASRGSREDGSSEAP